jgi:uncharacterized protein YgfB (UPF0149 family)
MEEIEKPNTRLSNEEQDSLNEWMEEFLSGLAIENMDIL